MAPAKPIPLNLAHQEIGTQFLRDRQSAGLFDEQGLGKSKQVIDALSAEIAAGNIRAAIIVCPNSLKSNWAAEIEKFSDRTYAVFGSGRSARRMAFQSLRAEFYVINYEAIPAELPAIKALLRFKSTALVLDESHRIKTPDSNITRAVLSLRSHAARRYILSGTPVANKPEDIWAQMFFLDDGASVGRTLDEFKNRFGTGQGGYRDLEQLRDQIAQSSLRRTKATSLSLPEKNYIRLAVPLEGRQLSMYQTMRTELELWVRSASGEEILASADSILAKIIRLSQLASNPTLIDKSYSGPIAKLTALDGLVSEYVKRSASQKLIVWTSFVENIPMLLGRFRHLCPVAIHGAMDTESRDRSVRLFREDPGTRMMVANPSAAREGLTLTEANVAIYFDRTFNLVDYLQSQDRIHRISQTQACDIVILVASATVDEFIDFSLEQKHRLARYAQSDSTNITDDDLALQKPDLLRALLSEVPQPD